MNKRSLKNSRLEAFTLVELLVVIGIIALLISILLPSLNKARQSANLIKCQANLHGIGEALAIYESQYKAALPEGLFSRVATPDNQQTQWYWTFALGEILNRNMLGTDGYVHNLSKVFTDVDTIEGPNRNYVQHYTANPRLFYSPYEYTFGNAKSPQDIFHKPINQGRKVTDVRQSANVFAIWDGAQASAPASSPLNGGLDYNVHEVAEGIDGYGFYFTGLCFPNGDINSITVQADLPILPTTDGNPGLDDGTAAQKQDNVDVDQYNGNGSPPWQSLRFRHLRNTRLNALCLDGHVEVRAVGSVLRRDIYTNVP